MKTNYYALKREAAKIITDTVEYLQSNPKKSVPLARLTIDFQTRFGFGQSSLLKMLEPYFQDNKLTLNEGTLQCKTQ